MNLLLLRLALYATIALAVLPANTRAATTPTIDSLVVAYEKAPASQKTAAGQRLIARLGTDEGLFFGAPPRLSSTAPRDSADLCVWFSMARFCYRNAFYQEGIDYCDRALPLARGGKNTSPLLPTLLCDRGYMLFKMGRMTEATETEQQAVSVAQQHGDDMQLSRAYLYLAIINHVSRRPDEAKELVRKSIAIDRRLPSAQQAHNTLGIACEIYSVAGDLEEGERYGREAVAAARQLGDSAAVANHLSQLSYTYDRMKRYDDGIRVADAALALVDAMSIVDRNLKALTLEYKAYNLLDQGRNAESVDVLRQAMDLQQELGNMRSYCIDYRTLSEALAPIDSAASMEALRRYTEMYDTIFVADLGDKISEADAAFHNDELTDENAQQRHHNRLLRLAVTALLATVALLAAFLWRGNRANRLLLARIDELVSRQTKGADGDAGSSGSPGDTGFSRDGKGRTSDGGPVGAAEGAERSEGPGLVAPDDAGVESDGGNNHPVQMGKHSVHLSEVDAVILRLMPQGKADITHVAEHFCMSPSQLRRRIALETRLTPANYIMAVRMAEAKRLLALYPKHNINEVATLCGFADSAHFSHAFSRLFGVSPLKYVKQGKG